jgi:hypothetical protein
MTRQRDMTSYQAGLTRALLSQRYRDARELLRYTLNEMRYFNGTLGNADRIERVTEARAYRNEMFVVKGALDGLAVAMMR